jgi:hypothetical protein
MPKKPESFRDRCIHWFTRHPWLKLISLVLAVIVWFYVNGKIVDAGF